VLLRGPCRDVISKDQVSLVDVCTGVFEERTLAREAIRSRCQGRAGEDTGGWVQA
jgi:hypothetical protein